MYAGIQVLGPGGARLGYIEWMPLQVFLGLTVLSKLARNFSLGSLPRASVFSPNSNKN